MEFNKILKKHNFRFNKRYGQNFISDANLLAAIVSDSGITAASRVLEIGAGAGSLTRVLSGAAADVVSYEIDRNLQPVLEESLSGCGNVRLVFKDFLKESDDDIAKNFEKIKCGAGCATRCGAGFAAVVDAAEVASAQAVIAPSNGTAAVVAHSTARAVAAANDAAVERHSPRNGTAAVVAVPAVNAAATPPAVKLARLTVARAVVAADGIDVVANLPYYITAPIIFKLLESELNINSITVMVQKEVAQRMLAKPATPEYGAFSVAIDYRTDAKITRIVKKTNFFPQPIVDSAVVRLSIAKNKYKLNDEKTFFRLTRAAFAMRRKTLVNNLTRAFDLSRTAAEGLLGDCGIDVMARGETLSTPQLVKLSDKIGKMGISK